MPQLVTENLSLKAWVRDRILFLALVIFFFGGAFYIGAGKFLDPQNEWLHPIKFWQFLPNSTISTWFFFKLEYRMAGRVHF